MTFFRNIIYSGLSDSDIYQKKRGIVFSNWISLILCAAVLLLFIFKNLLFDNIPYGININFLSLGLVLFLGPVLLNRFSLTTLSRLFLCFAPVFFIWFVYFSQMRELAIIETSIYDSLRIHLLAVSFLPYLLFDKRKPHILLLGIMPTLVSFIFFEYFMNLAGVSIDQRGIRGDDYQLMQMRTMIGYIIISGGGYTFHCVIIHNDEFNQQLLSLLKKKSKRIEVQNERLLQSQSKLNEVNQHLEKLVEKKTENIKRKNESLKKYAYSNAHHVRGPVARLLGLIQLYRMKSDLDNAWFFEKIEHEIKEIDKITQRIAIDLNSIDVQSMNENENNSPTYEQGN